MKKIIGNKYGDKPYSVIVVHGGPGAPGSATSLAKILSERKNILEPFQTANTVDGQIKELKSVIDNHSSSPVILVGHSWGAWLVFLFAANYQSLVKKIILVGSGPFEDKYVTEIMKTRLERLSNKEKSEVDALKKILSGSQDVDKSVFKKFGELMTKADMYEHVINEIDENIDFQPDIFKSVWSEASAMRKKGSLLDSGKRINCPVIAIHGNYDPHPIDGVGEPLSKVVNDFKLVTLEKCGHYPWKEKFAKEKFIEIINQELNKE